MSATVAKVAAVNTVSFSSHLPSPLVRLLDRAFVRQFASFFGIGLLAAGTHFAILVALVELRLCGPVAASLIGYWLGGGVSYSLNRRHTYASDRPHRQATWRFCVVAAIGFGLTWLLMSLFVPLMPYFVAQVLTTGTVMFWSFGAHKLWTFRDVRIPLA